VTTIVRTEGLVKRYDKTVAIAGVDLDIAEGEIFGLVGPNGAGKTSTLRMIATTLEPTSGTVRVAGHDVRSEPREVCRSIGFLTGNTAPYGRLTAREVIAYFGRLYGLEDALITARTGELAGRLQMADFLDRRCDKLSMGQKQKVSIARTIVHDPPVLILDEPTAGLDVLAARAILELIRDCRARRKTVLFSTHVMTEAEKLADRVGILFEGRLVREGTADELRAATGAADLEEAFLKCVGAA
jgi:sodium transport system ATP-binding protein